MKKRLHLKNLQRYFRHSSPIKKLKLAGIISMVLLTISMQSQAQVQKKINLSLQDVTLKEAFKAIEAQTGYAFFYSNENVDIDQKISINVKNSSIDKVIKQLLPNHDYRLEQEKVVVLPAKKSTDSQSEQAIKGNIVDELGEPIIGAGVLIKGTSTGTATDLDGNFSLDTQKGDILLISYIGYLEQQVRIGSETSYTIRMEEDNKMLEEVVVIGYGVEKKVNVIGSIAQIDSKKLENRSTPQLSNALTGQMAGVTVIQRSGRPGESGGEIRVRGVGSFGATPSALILIDGIPGNMNDVSPEDVESISVLKDASTAAIYGSRAANGVILITTKTGKEGKISVGYSGYAGFNKATELPEFVNSWEWADMYNKAKGGSPAYSAEDIEMMRTGSNTDKFANVHYLDEILDHTGFQTGHDLTLNGGDKKNKYMLSLGYLSQDGIVEKNNYSRYNIRANIINELASNLQLTTRIAGTYSKVLEPKEGAGDDADGMTGLVEQAVRLAAFYPAILSDGSFGEGPRLTGTPISGIKSDSFYKNPKYVIDANLKLEYKPVNGLTLSAMGAYKFTNAEVKKFRATQIFEKDKINKESSIENEMSKNRYKSFQATADYSLTLDKHNFGIMAGYSWEDQDYRQLWAKRTRLPGNSKPEISVGDPGEKFNNSSGWDWAMQSVFGRFKYNYNEKYLFETTMRYDGSTRFGKNHKYAFFPSLAAGWRISEEEFMKENQDLKWISNLKLKTSWGRLGNENIGNYQSQVLYEIGHDYPFGGILNQGFAVTKGKDPNLKWEATETIDGGFEAIFWNGLLTTNLSYFYRKSTDILAVPSTVSLVWGLTPTRRNGGELRNTGWEVELGHQNKIGEVSYNVGVNMSFIKNRVMTLGPGSDIPQLNGMVGNGSTLFVGHPLEMYYGYVTDGVFLDQADIDSWYDQSAVNPNPKPGDVRFVDLDGDDKVDPNHDRKSLGSRIPKMTYGISLGAAYKGVDFSLLLQGVSGVKGMLENYAGWAFFSNTGNVQRWQKDGAFDPENPTRNPAYPRLETISNVAGPNQEVSDFWVQDASYMRVKNVQLGYTIPRSALSKIGIANARLYLQAENPLTFHNYPKGWDPEINTSGNYYPILKTYTFGVNLKF